MSYKDKVLKLLEDFRINKSYTDVTILVGEERFPAHKLILRTASEYFRGLFDSGMKEGNEDEMRIDGITSDVFRNCLDFIYGKNILEQSDSVPKIELLLAANMLLLDDLVKDVVEMVINELTIESCVEAWKKSELITTCEDWEDQVLQFICKNVEKLPLKLTPYKLLEKIFISNNLHIPRESKLFEMLVEWMEVNEEASQDNFCSLFQLIRLPVMDRDYLRQHIRKCKHLDDCDVCQNYWKQTVLYIYGEENHDLTESHMSPRNIINFTENDILVVDKSNTTVFRFWDGELQNIGVKLPSFPYPTSNESLQMYKGTFYLMGGDDDRRIFKCKPRDVEWEFICRMPNFHNDNGFHSSVFVYGQCICVIGGKVNNAPVTLVDCYNPVKGTWCEFPELKSVADKFGSFVTYKKKLFAIGGFDEPHNIVWKYSCVGTKWLQQPEMNYKRYSHSSAVHGGKIFVVGGLISNRRSSSVETYMDGDSRWTNMSSLQCIRSRCLLLDFRDNLFVYGGYSSSWKTSTYEYLSKNTNKWKKSDETVNDNLVLNHINRPPMDA